MNSRNDLTEQLGYRFRDEALLERALTHSSYVNEQGRPYEENNERLEFLGDAVLDLIVGEALLSRCPHEEEGVLSKTRAIIVCESALAQLAQRLGIGERLLLGHGEALSGGRQRASMLADAMEAVLGAVYLDGGLEAVRGVALRLLSETMEEALSGKGFQDYKTRLQEALQAHGRQSIVYRVEREEGPDHDKTFFVSVSAGERLLGRGSGKNKKEAEQRAAQAALEELK